MTLLSSPLSSPATPPLDPGAASPASQNPDGDLRAALSFLGLGHRMIQGGRESWRYKIFMVPKKK